MRRLTQEEYETKVHEYSPNIKILGKYQNSRTKIHVQCNKCNYEWNPKAQSLIDGVNKDMCPNCHKVQHLIVKDLYDLLEKYSKNIYPLYYKEYDNDIIRSKDHILLYDERCGHTYIKTYNQIMNYGCNCPYCSNYKVLKGFNDVYTTDLWLANLLEDKDEAYLYTAKSSHKTYFKCPICQERYFKSFYDVFHNGLACKNCSDGISYPEKFMMNILKECNIRYEFQYVIGDYIYDFYLPDYNYIIETHGQQHYDNGFQRIKSNSRSIRDELQNDIDKQEFIYKSGFTGEYIVIDCRNSEPLFIKNSILSHKTLSTIINFKNIDIYDIHKMSLKSNILLACELYQQNHTIDQIKDIMCLSRNTIIKYLKQGNDCNICNYDSSNFIETLIQNNKIRSKRVRCITTNKSFNSLKEASDFYGISISLLSSHLSSKRRRAGVDKNLKQDLIWEFIQ